MRAIHSEHFLEHIPDAEGLVREAARVLEPGGSSRAVVPHFSNPHFYSDPPTAPSSGLYTFSYWVRVGAVAPTDPAVRRRGAADAGRG